MWHSVAVGYFMLPNDTTVNSWKEEELEEELEKEKHKNHGFFEKVLFVFKYKGKCYSSCYSSVFRRKILSFADIIDETFFMPNLICWEGRKKKLLHPSFLMMTLFQNEY